MHEFFRRIRYILNRRRLDEELANEMEFHREMVARQGAEPFGDSIRLREEAREVWGWTWIDRLFQDLRYAFRMLRKSPGFTLAAVLMLAIGIGVNVAAFSFFDLMVLRPMNVRDPGTLQRFHRRAVQNYAFALPYPEMAFFREHSRTLSTVLALNSTRLSLEGEEKPLNAHFVTPNYLLDLGAEAILGRIFADPLTDAAPVAVLNYAFWQRHFAGDPTIVGKTIHLSGQPVTVIGIASAGFNGLSLEQPALWAPITQQPHYIHGSRLLTDYSVESSGVFMWGRVPAGMNPKLAGDELRLLAAELRKSHPVDIWDQEGFPSEPGGYAKSLTTGLRRGTGKEATGELFSVLALVGTLSLLILAIACGNLGSLLLARGVAREREIAIRISVGAGRARLVRQLFTESLLLALLGSAVGVISGYFVLRSLLTMASAPGWMSPTPDWTVMFFAAGMAFVSAILFGLTPALQAARQRHRAAFMRRVLVGAQVAASCVLLIVAGLLVRALNHAVSSDPGFAYQQVIAVDAHLSNHGYSPTAARAFLETLRSRLQTLPGVAAVSLTDTPPFGNRVASGGISIDGHSTDTLLVHVDGTFFDTLKIPLLRGRALKRADAGSIVVSDSVARRLWPGQDALGKKLSFGGDNTVVGISGNARLVKLEDPDMGQIFFPSSDPEMPSLVALVKTTGSPEPLIQTAASLTKSLDPVLFPDVQLLKSSFRRKLEPVQTISTVVSLLGSLAHLLACLGIVGLVAYAVSQRTKEIGIRVALGARPAHVLSTVLRQFSIPVVAGLALGVAGAAGLAQLLRHQLYGISNLDPVTYLAAIAVFIATVAVAALLPARKALRVDPMLALRQD